MQSLKWKAGTSLCQLHRWDDLGDELAEYLFAVLLNGSAKSKLTADDVKTLPTVITESRFRNLVR